VAHPPQPHGGHAAQCDEAHQDGQRNLLAAGRQRLPERQAHLHRAPDAQGRDQEPVPARRRILRVDKDQAAVTLPTDFSTAKNRELTDIRIAELRAADGLPKRKNTYKMVGNTEVLAKPDTCTISEMKQERGFVYFNLNGGDSWAYYHPENNPDFIHNFKGEPAYLTKELLPEYWEQLTAQGSAPTAKGAASSPSATGPRAPTGAAPTTRPTTRSSCTQAKNETQIRHFAKQHGMPLGDYIPEWDLIFDPHDNVRVDHATKRVNRFTLSQYMRATARQVKAIPTTINRVIDHVLGHDPAVIEHFVNWLAFILQERDRTLTAWVLHGVPGTGKGILIKHILQPIFGAPHVTMRRMEELNEPYNHFMEQALIVFVDEMQAKALHNEEGVMAKLRNFITESQITIRGMFRNAYDARNYTNWIFASNKPDPVAIPENDRRMNVAKYQVIGNMPATPNKLTSLLKHHRIHIDKVWINNATASGIKTTWGDQTQFPAWLAQLQPKLPANVLPMKKAKV
jgi:hypothetical protein